MMEENVKTNEPNPVDELIVKYLGGNSSPDEIRQLELWVGKSEENGDYFRQLSEIWEHSQQLHISNENALTKVLNRIYHNPPTFNLWNVLQKIAAVLFIPLLVGTFWLLNEYSSGKGNELKNRKVVAAFGTYTHFQLPDGSKVWLNSGSSLEYPDEFATDKRIINLSGEAYLEVCSNQKSPFFVNTPFFIVKATGTRFNVSAYKNWQYPSVALAEGVVSVQKPASTKNEDRLVILRPDQCLQMDTSTGEFSVVTEDSYKHFAWKDGKLVFRNDLLSNVAKRISLQYNVDIEIIGNQMQQYRYRATFENESLGELLTLLKLSSPFDFKEISQEIRPDGTFTRKKILIYSINK